MASNIVLNPGPGYAYDNSVSVSQSGMNNSFNSSFGNDDAIVRGNTFRAIQSGQNNEFSGGQGYSPRGGAEGSFIDLTQLGSNHFLGAAQGNNGEAFDGQIHVIQEGNDGYIGILQGCNGSGSSLSEYDIAMVNQIGTANWAWLEQGTSDGHSVNGEATIYQQGNNNEAGIYQGVGEVSDSNTAWIEQTGNGNIASISQGVNQLSALNSTSVYQHGDMHETHIVQDQYNSTVEVSQTGTGHTVFVNYAPME